MEPTELEQFQKKCIKLCLQFHDLEVAKQNLLLEITNIKKLINAELLKKQENEKESDNEK